MAATWFHCTPELRAQADRSRHAVAAECERLKAVLRAVPDYGVVVPGTGGLRKMRVQVRGLAKGKRGGYRTLYSRRVVAGESRIAFHAVWFKGEREDLDASTYARLSAASRAISEAPSRYPWEE